jgi:hypothetical protein|tara:strand:+ start:376 stop:612 length:237 start_codon:yes stop_codon:yes gene_type:complete
MTDQLEDDYQTAYDIGLDCLSSLDKSGVNPAHGLAALLTVVTHAAYVMAPDDKEAEGMIAFATDMARENWAAERLKNQ